MKHITMITLAGALLSTAVSAQTTAYSKPSGYVTHTLKAGQFNLIGLTLHEPVTVSGIFETVNGTSLTDDDVDFDSTLTAGKTYILEITENTADPTMVGVIQEVTSWTGNTLTTPADLDTDGLATGAKYQLRAAKTIADVFGANNEAGLLAATNITSADVVWLPNGSGFDKFYYSPGGGFGGGTAGWKDSSGQESANRPIVYTDAIFIQSRGTEDNELVITGAVKVEGTSLALAGDAFNFLSSTFPAGSTLDNSGLEDGLTQATNITSADVVWMPDGSGGYNKYYYSPGGGFGGGTAGWKDSSGQDAGSTPLTSAIIIQRKGSDTNADLTPPAEYGSL